MANVVPRAKCATTGAAVLHAHRHSVVSIPFKPTTIAAESHRGRTSNLRRRLLRGRPNMQLRDLPESPDVPNSHVWSVTKRRSEVQIGD